MKSLLQHLFYIALINAYKNIVMEDNKIMYSNFNRFKNKVSVLANKSLQIGLLLSNASHRHRLLQNNNINCTTAQSR